MRSISSKRKRGATTASRVEILRPVVTLLAQRLQAQPTLEATSGASAGEGALDRGCCPRTECCLMAAQGPRERGAITWAVRRRSISSGHGAATAARAEVLRPVVTLLAQTLRHSPRLRLPTWSISW